MSNGIVQCGRPRPCVVSSHLVDVCLAVSAKGFVSNPRSGGIQHFPSSSPQQHRIPSPLATSVSLLPHTIYEDNFFQKMSHIRTFLLTLLVPSSVCYALLRIPLQQDIQLINNTFQAWNHRVQGDKKCPYHPWKSGTQQAIMETTKQASSQPLGVSLNQSH
jgi:hypothetical protein